MTELRLVALGDLETDVWGVSWITAEPDRPQLAIRVGPVARVLDVEFERDNAGWKLEGDGVSLTFTPTTTPIESADTEAYLRRHDQLCEVTGRLRVDAQDTEVACLGWRSSAAHEAELNQFDSLRFVAAWLDPREGFSLTAVRPRRARGHEADAVAAALADESRYRVVDPRLSTTYTDAGVPARAGLELWLEPESASEEETAMQYPRRAAGELTGAALDWSQGDIALHASPVRWHSHGREGPGVYVLGQRR